MSDQKLKTAVPVTYTGEEEYYEGKVRNKHTLSNGLVVLEATDRISAYDHEFEKLIPFKGQVLNQISKYMFDETKDICPNWILSNPVPTISIGRKCKPFMIEVIVRGYIAGSAWKDYAKGSRLKSGVSLPDGMKENQKFPEPIITPTDKAKKGQHDEDITDTQILERGLATFPEWKLICNYALKLFERGTKIADEAGLILVDTKYEFGKDEDGKIYLIDEIHTPDSSRYFYKDTYEENQRLGLQQRQLSKEFVREWLKNQGFTGDPGQTVPQFTEEFVDSITDRYIELYEVLTGQKFVKCYLTDSEKHDAVENYISHFNSLKLK